MASGWNTRIWTHDEPNRDAVSFTRDIPVQSMEVKKGDIRVNLQHLHNSEEVSDFIDALKKAETIAFPKES